MLEPANAIDPAPSDAPAGTEVLSRPERYRAHTPSYVRRSTRMTTPQQRAWREHREEFVVPVPRGEGGATVDPTVTIDPVKVFGRSARLVVEIGSGQGEAVVAAAASDPGSDFLAVEVYIPGLAQTIHRSLHRELANVRLVQADAVEVLTSTLPEGCADEMWVFFPDPWHKTRHVKRRLVSPEFAQLVRRALRSPRGGLPGGILRLATDWAAYGRQMLRVLDAADGLENVHGPGQAAPRFDGRALTGFEKKAGVAGRAVIDLTYRRV